MPIPTDAPVTTERVELGRYLFYDTRLSASGNTACATCHQQRLAFTDGKIRSTGDAGEPAARNAPTLANIGYAARLGWANPLLDRLEAQARVPMFGEHPIEMGLLGHETETLARLAADPDYQRRFARAFPDDEKPFTIAHIITAIATFERTLVSGNSPYDHYLQGEDLALSNDAQRGMKLFFSEKLECFHCHGGFNFTDAVGHDGRAGNPFHNTGLYNLGKDGSYPIDNPGVYEVTKDPADMGRFKAPTLRNIAVTAPYMHDGSIATLDGVIDHYMAGGRSILNGPNAGDGARNPHKSEFVAGFTLSADERRELLAFLNSLTDEEFLNDPRFADPRATQAYR